MFAKKDPENKIDNKFRNYLRKNEARRLNLLAS